MTALGLLQSKLLGSDYSRFGPAWSKPELCWGDREVDNGDWMPRMVDDATLGLRSVWRRSSSERLLGDGLLPTLGPRDCCLVLTASIIATATQVALRSPQMRTAEYIRAFEFWFRKLGVGDAIVWLDASTADLTPIIATARASDLGPSVVIGQLEGQPATQKGIGDASILSTAIRICSPSLSDSTVILKCTGRLRARAASEILGIAREDGTDVLGRLRSDLQWADSRLFGFKRGAARIFEGMETEIDEPSKRYMEHVLADRLLIAEASGLTRTWMPHPRYRGREGTSGARYGSIPSRFRAKASDAISRRAHEGSFWV